MNLKIDCLLIIKSIVMLLGASYRQWHKQPPGHSSSSKIQTLSHHSKGLLSITVISNITYINLFILIKYNNVCVHGTQNLNKKLKISRYWQLQDAFISNVNEPSFITILIPIQVFIECVLKLATRRHVAIGAIGPIV